jgi:pimeloyl-ACP methyl ester carboxylesterase
MSWKWIGMVMLALGAAGAGWTVDAAREEASAHARANDVLLVHGAWTDGSSWSGVIRRLHREGFEVTVVQLREQSLSDDVALVRHAIGQIGRPLVVVGHSYGGAVISGATVGLSHVVGLVFVAAFALDRGETMGGVSAGFPTPPAIAHLVADDQGDTIIESNAFVRFFAPDLPRSQARVLAAVQQPLAGAVLSEPAGEPGWRTIPSFYQVSTDDQVIDPDLERFFARRMGAYTVELESSHVSLISHPDAIAELIARASR